MKKEKAEWRITANENILFKYRINDKGELECRKYECEGEDAYGRITYLDTGTIYTTKDYEINQNLTDLSKSLKG